MAKEKPFDPKHPRCIYPVFGRNFDDALRKSGLTVPELAKKLAIREENVRAYRRGFQHPSSAVMADVERHLSATLDIPESAPDAVTWENLDALILDVEGVVKRLRSMRMALAA